MKELGAQSQAIEDVIKNGPNAFEKEIWENAEYIRLVWSGGPEGIRKRQEEEGESGTII